IADLDRLFEAHPELTLVVAFHDDVMEVVHRFCGRADLKQPHKFPTKVQKVSFSGKNLIKIGHNFFWGCPFIQAVDFRGLRALQSVGNSFFEYADTLKSVDLMGLTALVNIGNFFFSKAKSVQFLDTRGLSAVEQIGNSFFYGARQLTHAYLSYLKNVKGIGDQFLAYVPIQEIDISAMTKLERIGGYFFYHTHALESVKFGKIENLKIIGNNFLASCSSLKCINLSGCPNLQSIGSGFLQYANPKIDIYCHDEAIKLLMQKAMV
ncbi:MAG: leucine-rich repeat protein, partial [Alphaproteobacteria bacterium]|nr:leucine-rich repeat protein [Alphaproteobacteria bacterium]